MLKAKEQTYNDGVVLICAVKNIAEKGELPVEKLETKGKPLRFSRRIMGFNRYCKMLYVDVKISGVIRCQEVPGISPQDVAVINGQQYRIELIQYPEGIAPPSMDLTLSKIGETYEFKKTERNPAYCYRSSVPL